MEKFFILEGTMHNKQIWKNTECYVHFVRLFLRLCLIVWRKLEHLLFHEVGKGNTGEGWHCAAKWKSECKFYFSFFEKMFYVLSPVQHSFKILSFCYQVTLLELDVFHSQHFLCQPYVSMRDLNENIFDS